MKSGAQVPVHTIDAEECRIEYSKSWIKACLFNYMLGKVSRDTLEHDIHMAKTYGISRAIFQIIIESLPFDRGSDRFRDIMTVLRKDTI